MRLSASDQDQTLAWEVVAPRRPSRLPGVTMAGFRDRGRAPRLVRLVPHPGITLVMDFGDTPVAVIGADQREHNGSLAVGLGLGSAKWGRTEQLATVQVRLSPTTAAGVLGAGLAELRHGPVSLDDLWERAVVARLREQLRDAPSWEERFALVETLLMSRPAVGPRLDPEVAHAWHQMVVGQGRVRIEHLAAEVGWNRKQFWSRFHGQIGLPPKRAANLIRFDRAVHGLVGGHDMAGVAADSGYVDQSHLHRDVRTFAGITPGSVSDEPFLAVDRIAWPTSTPRRRWTDRTRMGHGDMP